MYEVPYTSYMGLFLCIMMLPILYGSFLCTKPPIYMGPSQYCSTYSTYCLPILHKIYMESVIRTTMGQSYVHRLLWDLTLVHKMVPYI